MSGLRDGLKGRGVSPKGVRGEQNVVDLPEATRDDQMRRWGITPERTGERFSAPDPDIDRGRSPHARIDDDIAEHLRGGGWSMVTHTEGGGRDGGMTSHSGVLHPDEYVDADTLATMVVAEFGFTVEEVQSVYRQGRKSRAQVGLRDRIDARLLEVADAGGHLGELGRALGLTVDSGGHCKAIRGALERARARRKGNHA